MNMSNTTKMIACYFVACMSLTAMTFVHSNMTITIPCIIIITIMTAFVFLVIVCGDDGM